jgi:hypothetical protein
MTLRWLFLTTLLIALAGPGLAAGILVSPVQVGLVGKPGTAVSDVIRVSPSRQEATDVQVTLVDFTKDEDGRLRELPPGEARRSCKSWIELDKVDFKTAETGVVEVRVIARIPEQAAGSYWALLMFTVPPPKGPMGGVGMRVVPRVAVPVIVTTPEGGRRQVSITSVQAQRMATEQAVEGTAVVENTGDVAVLVGGAFALERPADKPEDVVELGATDVGPLTSLPGTRLKVRGKVGWKGSSAGLVLRTYLRYGPDAGDAIDAVTSIDESSAPPAPPVAPGGLGPTAPTPPRGGGGT